MPPPSRASQDAVSEHRSQDHERRIGEDIEQAELGDRDPQPAPGAEFGPSGPQLLRERLVTVACPRRDLDERQASAAHRIGEAVKGNRPSRAARGHDHAGQRRSADQRGRGCHAGQRVGLLQAAGAAHQRQQTGQCRIEERLASAEDCGKKMNTHSGGDPVSSSAASSSWLTQRSPSDPIITVRRDRRSAITPPISTRQTSGMASAASTKPTSDALWPSCKTAKVSATGAP